MDFLVHLKPLKGTPPAYDIAYDWHNGENLQQLLTAPLSNTHIQRDPTAVWKIGLYISVLLNLPLVYWLLFLPK